jgi:DNA-binding CsgD family transcriptional regulator
VVRLGDLAVVRGEVESAAHLYEEGFAYLHELGDTRWAARATHGLGTLSLRRGEYGEAHALLLESLRRFYEFGARLEVAECLESTAALAASIDQPELAARLTGAMDSLRETICAPLPPVYRPQHDRMVSLLRRRLGPSAFAGAYAAGRAMTLEQAAAEAITLTIKPTRPPMSRKPALSLTRREHEVAALIAQGLTNRRIAAALFITDHTVESHVENILNKLGFNARTQIAAWATASENRPAPAL